MSVSPFSSVLLSAVYAGPVLAFRAERNDALGPVFSRRGHDGPPFFFRACVFKRFAYLGDAPLAAKPDSAGEIFFLAS
jgi:hypothetical protein